jgi:phosphatidate cytidylyltransferase
VPDLASASPRGRRWGDLRLRVLSALVLLPVGLGCLWAGGWVWAALVALAAVGLTREWAALCRESGPWAAAVAIILVAAAATVALGDAVTALCILAGGTIAVAAMRWRIGPALGLPYIGLPVVALVWLRAAPDAGRSDVLFVLLVVWATDIAAYLVGRIVGGPRLAPSISPGKTWSGAVGGFLGALLVGLVAGLAALPLAAALSVVAQAGDLMESGLKRRFGVKDSGKLIPGHGGLLDRLDGVLTAAPAAALLVLITGRGVGFWQ